MIILFAFLNKYHGADHDFSLMVCPETNHGRTQWVIGFFHMKSFRIWINSLFIFIFVFLLHTRLYSYETDLTYCGLPDCKVQCTCSQEVAIACKAVKRAIRFFKDHGYDLKTHIQIEFIEKSIKDEIKNGTRKPGSNDFFCYYNSKTKCITISSWKGYAQWNRKAFGSFPMDTEFFTSMVTHEVVHRLFDYILEARGQTSDRVFHEFVAYIAQIETMEELHKHKVLALWPGEELPSLYAVNSFVWMVDPHKFSILAYNFFKSQPGVIKKIIDGRIKPIEIRLIMEY